MKTLTKNNVYSFLRDGGELGELTRNFDWSQTPVGNPDKWPQSLLTTVGNLLHSQFPMFLWWGPEMIQFYNDAYRPSMGNEGKHPTALGQNGQDCWPEIWPIIYPLIEQVRDTGKPTWMEDQLVPIFRNGKIEDVYWTYSYSSVLDDEGEHGGILVTCVETTDKVNNLKKLAESEHALRFAIDAAELGTWDYNPLTNNFNGNARLKEWFGLAPEGEIDLSLAISVIAEHDQERVTEAIRKSLQYESGGFYDIEYNIRNPFTQQDRIVKAKGRAWFNEEKIAYRFNGTLQDITQQALSMKKISEANERAALSIEAAELGTFEVNLLTNETITSERLDKIFGVIPSQGQKNHIHLIHPDDLPIREAAHKQAYKTGSLQYEARIIWNDGSIHWMRAQGKISYNDERQPIKLLGVVQDITEEKSFWQELERQVKTRTEELVKVQETLLNANTYFQTIINLCKEPVQVLEPVFSGNEIVDFRFKLTNNAYAAYANSSPDKLQNKMVGEVFPGYFETSVFIKVTEVFKTGMADSWELHYNQDGLDLYNQMSATRIGDEVVVYFTDFTRLKHLQLELIRKIEELERSNKNLEEFAYAASHDLKEPVRKIHFFNDRIKNSLWEDLSEENKRSFERMQSAAIRMSSLIDSLISYSQVNFFPKLMEEINMNEVLDKVLNDLDVEIEEKNATVKFDELCTVKGFHRQMQQVFQNLIVNALKYSRPEVPPVIFISCKKITGNEIDANTRSDDSKKFFYALLIEDNGIGFEQKDAERIFNVFTRLHGNTEYRGSGIGLSTVRKIIDNHHGYINAKSIKGKGSAFTMYLPVN